LGKAYLENTHCALLVVFTMLGYCSDGLGSKIFDPGQGRINFCGSGWIRLGQPFMFWVWIRKISPKNQILSSFLPSRAPERFQSILSRPKIWLSKHVWMEYYDFLVFTSVLWLFMTKICTNWHLCSGVPRARQVKCGSIHLKVCLIFGGDNIMKITIK